MTSDLRPVDMHTTIPDALRREIDDDLAAGGERARKWRPRATLGVTRILALDGPYAGRVGTPTGIAGWTYDDGNFGRIFISADGGTPWLFGLDETPPSHPVTAWAPVGSIDRPRGLDLQAPNPRPADGDRVLVLDAPTDWVVGNVATCRIAGGSPAVRVDETRDLFFIHRWALLPPAVSDSAAVERVPAAVTTAARQAAYDAALDGLYSVKWPDGSPYLGIATRHARKLAETAVDAALASLAGDARDSDAWLVHMLSHNVYLCARDESAWGHGTMHLEDFSPAVDEAEFVADFKRWRDDAVAKAVARILLVTEGEA